MLFDEATAALDPKLSDDIAVLIRELAASGMAVIVVTHEMRLAETVADACIFMDGGVILERGPACCTGRSIRAPAASSRA